MTKVHILLLIAAFITLTFGSFIWFIATWNADAEQPVSMQTTAPAFTFSQIRPPEAPHAYTRVTL